MYRTRIDPPDPGDEPYRKMQIRCQQHQGCSDKRAQAINAISTKDYDEKRRLY
jgi:hypothetical protein